MSSHHINLLFSAINDIYASTLYIYSQVTASHWWLLLALSSSFCPSGKVTCHMSVKRVHVPPGPRGLVPRSRVQYHSISTSDVRNIAAPTNNLTNHTQIKPVREKNVLVNSVPPLQAPAQSLIVRIKTFTKLLSEGPSKCNLIELTNDKCFVQL